VVSEDYFFDTMLARCPPSVVLEVRGVSMRRFVLLSFLAVSFLTFAQNNTAAPAPSPSPTASNAAKPSLSAERQIRKTVTFIKMTCASGDQTYESRGTGFFVSYPDTRIGEHGVFIYLVTNRHIAECWDKSHHPRAVQSVDITLNLRSGNSEVSHYGAGNVPWFLPTLSSVDLAVIPLMPDPARYDYIVVSTSDFVEDEEALSEGDKIMFSGFFYQFPGVRRMQPIVREGILAMLPDEDLTTTTGKPGKVYLGDVHIFHGNSGSPVMVNLGGIRRGIISGDSYKVLGVVSGMYDEDTDFNLQVTTTLEGTVHGNSGIAMIVPVSQLKALLDDPRLQANRDVQVPLIRQIEAQKKEAEKKEAQKLSANDPK
jgi:hypothetical protein